MPTVISVFNTSQFGSPDPSGLAYDPIAGGLFLVDSEVDETPFFSNTNMFSVNFDGSLQQAYSFASVSTEPTGVAFDPATGYLYVSDDDSNKIYVVDQADPTVKVAEFGTAAFGSTRTSDITMGPDGTLFILDQATRTIYQTTSDGTLIAGTPLPGKLKRPEALAYDAEHDVFYVAGGWSADLFKVSRTGEILETITVLRDHRLPDGGHAVPKGLALAPSSDGSGTSLWVADYGADQAGDGRLFEIGLNDKPPPPPAPLPEVAILDGAPIAQIEAPGNTVDFNISLSEAAAEDVIVIFSTVNGTATAGSDFVGVSGGQATIAAGEMSTTVSIQLLDDLNTEPAEAFTVRVDAAQLAASGTQLQIFDNSGVGTIAASDKVHIYDTTAFGSPDPAGLTYDSLSGRLFLVDSEVDESPFFSDTNMFAFDTQGNFLEGFSLTGFSDEATGVAYWRDPTTGEESLFITDDEEQSVCRVSLENPGVKLAAFSTLAFGCTDPEDIAVDPTSGNLFIIGELTRTIYETTQAGELVSSIVLPEKLKRPEAVAYDADLDVFYVSGGWSADIFKVDRSGAIIETITDLRPYRLDDGFHAVPKGLVLASASNGDGQSLWVADYGRDQVADGRLFEIRLEDSPMAIASASQPASDDLSLLG
jgi:DNA-binding beta-propeller fold protein YncE